MKKEHCILAALALVGAAVMPGWAEDIGETREFQVRVVQEIVGREKFRDIQGLEAKAKRDGVRQAVVALSATGEETPYEVIQRFCNAETRYVVPPLVPLNDSARKYQRIEIGGGLVQMVGEYKVRIDIDRVLQDLPKDLRPGLDRYPLIILEEQPTRASIKLNDLEGAGFGKEDKRWFMNNYTTFQRGIRDEIIKLIGEKAFDIRLLDDDPRYEAYRSPDGLVLGTYFDVEAQNFVTTPKMLDTVKENTPNAIVLYYRIDALDIAASGVIRASVAYSVKTLANGVTKSLGTQTGGGRVIDRTSKVMVMDDMKDAVIESFTKLMNAGKQTASGLLLKVVQEMTAPPTRTARLALSINAGVFDPTIRKRAMYALRKGLLAKKVALGEKDVVVTDTTLAIAAVNPEITSLEDLYFEYVSPILEGLGITLPDDKVNYINNKELFIKP